MPGNQEDVMHWDFVALNKGDLKTVAAGICLEIYKDFDAVEIRRQPESIQRAWCMGRELDKPNNYH